MIRKDKLTEATSGEGLTKESSEVEQLSTVQDIEARALAAFSDTEDLKDNE
jgi:hypothetical protein